MIKTTPKSISQCRKLQQIGKLAVRSHKADLAYEAAREALRKARGNWCSYCYGTATDGKPFVTATIDLAEYLALWPDATPKAIITPEWKRDADGHMIDEQDPTKQRHCFFYPQQWVALIDGFHFYVEAQSKTVIVPVVNNPDRVTGDSLPPLSEIGGDVEGMTKGNKVSRVHIKEETL